MPTTHKPENTFVPRNPDYQQRVRRSFDNQGAMKLFGAELIRISPGHCDIQIAYTDELSQQHGFFHGGILATIADSACGYAAFSLMPEDTSILTIEFKTNFLSPADGELLVARGRVIKPGRTITVSQADVMVTKDGRERLCATLTATNMAIHGKHKE